MRENGTPDPGERAIAAFVASVLGCEATRIARLDAFETNAVYEVDADGRRFVVKASTMHDALRAEAWACAGGADAGCGAPPIRAFGGLGRGAPWSAFLMNWVDGAPITAAHPVLREVGSALRRLHAVRLPGFGSLGEASWSEGGDFTLPHGSWLGYVKSICGDLRALASHSAVAAPIAEAADAAISLHADSLAAVEVGSLCHGDLKTTHILADGDRLVGVIDWGDAAVGDPLWDIARFAHRADAESLALLLEGYDPTAAMAEAIPWRLPLYGALWMIVDAVVEHRLGHRPDAALESAKCFLAERIV